MRKNLLFLGLLVLCIAQGVMAQTWNWVKEAKTNMSGGNASEMIQGFPVKIARSSNGDIYTLAKFKGQVTVANMITFTASNENGDLYLVKYLSSGTFMYARQIKAPRFYYSYDIAATADGDIAIMGSFTGSLNIESIVAQPPLEAGAGIRSFITKLSGHSGFAHWSKLADNGGYNALAADKTGNIYVTNITAGAYYQFDRSGNVIRQQSVTGSLSDIAVDEIGNVYLAGQYSAPRGQIKGFVSKYNFITHSQEWEKITAGTYAPLIPDNAYEIYLTLTETGPVIAANTSVEQFNSTGTSVWKTQVYSYVKGITGDHFGNVFIAGSKSIGVDQVAGYIHKYNRRGQQVWEKVFAGTSHDPSQGVASNAVVVDDQTLLVSGSISGWPTKLDNYVVGDFNGNLSHFIGSLKHTPELSLQSPNGGEDFAPGSTQVIRWNGSYEGTLFLEYSVDGGVTWTLINAVQASEKQYTWTIPGNINSAQCKVRLLNPQDNVWDESDYTFSIRPQTLQIISPTSTYRWMAGQKMSVSWRDNAVSRTYNCDMRYTNKFGKEEWTRLFTGVQGSATGDNSREVTIDPTIFDCDNSQRVLISLSRMAIDDNSRVELSSFSPLFTVTAPSCGYITQQDSKVQELATIAPAKEGISIYPNPASSVMNIKAVDLKDGKATMIIYSALGTVVSSMEVLVVGGVINTQVDIAKLPAGMYKLNLVNDGKITTQSFIKK